MGLVSVIADDIKCFSPPPCSPGSRLAPPAVLVCFDTPYGPCSEKKSYEYLMREIEVVVTVTKALQQYLDAPALTLSEDTKYMDKVTRLGESL